MRTKVIKLLLIVALLLVLTPLVAMAGESESLLDRLTSSFSADGKPQLAGVLQILLFFTILSFLPGLLLTMTSFTRIIIVLSFVRRAISIQMPPNQVLIGLSLFLTFFVMTPVWQDLNAKALQPYMEKEINQKEALSRGMGVLRGFMMKHTRKKDIALFIHVSKAKKPRNENDISTTVLIPAFVTSELKTAFQMGFVILLPFLVIDMVVAAVLTSMGMFMLPPVTISVPFKVLLFILVDGWHLVVRSLAAGFS